MVKLFALLPPLLGACQDVESPGHLPDLDRDAFRCGAQPVLQARCGFPICHGTFERPFRVYAPGRLRLDVPDRDRGDALTADEEEANFDTARAYSGAGGGPALLTLKPLDASAGGYFHRATDFFGGQDVFASEEDVGYRILRAWVDDRDPPDEDCVPTAEVGP